MRADSASPPLGAILTLFRFPIRFLWEKGNFWSLFKPLFFTMWSLRFYTSFKLNVSFWASLEPLISHILDRVLSTQTASCSNIYGLGLYISILRLKNIVQNFFEKVVNMVQSYGYIKSSYCHHQGSSNVATTPWSSDVETTHWASKTRITKWRVVLFCPMCVTWSWVLTKILDNVE